MSTDLLRFKMVVHIELDCKAYTLDVYDLIIRSQPFLSAIDRSLTSSRRSLYVLRWELRAIIWIDNSDTKWRQSVARESFFLPDCWESYRKTNPNDIRIGVYVNVLNLTFAPEKTRQSTKSTDRFGISHEHILSHSKHYYTFDKTAHFIIKFLI